MNRHTVLITGASSGIGKALAEEYARHGYDLVLVARRKQILDELSQRFKRDYGSSCHVIAADLCKDASAAQILKDIKAAGMNVDILVNNAGMGDAAPFRCESWEKIESIIDLNIKATTRLTRLFLEEMVSRGSGTIVNIASTMAFAPSAWQAVYAASKSYVLSLSQALAEECKNTGVKVLAICPGLTDTGFFDAAGISKGNLKAARPEDFAHFAYRRIVKGKTLSTYGWLNKLASAFSRLFPRSLVRKVFAAVSRPQMQRSPTPSLPESGSGKQA